MKGPARRARSPAPARRARSPAAAKRARSSAAAVPVPTGCEGLIATIGPPSADPERALALARAVASTLEGEWRVRPLSREGRSFRLTRHGRPLSPAQAWSLARRLRAHRDVVDAEPALRLPGIEPPPELAVALHAGAGPRGRARSLGKDQDLPCSTSRDWSLRECRIPDAWALFSGVRPPRRPGESIVVGHPDTGYTKHPAIWSDDPARNRVLARDGRDFEDDDLDATDPLEPGNPGHGTSTASVIMSDAGAASGGLIVPGVAPGSRLVPLRVSTSVIHLFSYSNLIESIGFAADHGCHVISMSLGGPLPSPALEEALCYAVARGVIPIAAAGNVWPWVVYPARCDETVAVAACNCRRGIWKKSAAGGAVDLTAPGESVWNARAGSGQFSVGRGSGTSFATAIVAGTAALWLSYHGRDALILRYGREHLVAVFKELLLTRGVTRPRGWKRDEYGAGLLDVCALLQAPLPETAPAAGVRGLRAAVAPRRESDSDRLVSYFPEQDPDAVRRGMAVVLRTDRKRLESILADFGDELAFHAALNPAFRAAVHAGARRVGARGARTGAVARLRADPRFASEASVDLRRRVGVSGAVGAGSRG